MADPTISSARQRSTRTILAAIALGSTSLYTAFTASVLVATDLGASPSWVGTPGAAGVIGTALGAAWLSRVMARKGRRLGLTWGWAVGTVGAVLAIVAVVADSFAGLILAMIPLGLALMVSGLLDQRLLARSFAAPAGDQLEGTRVGG